MTFTRIFMPVLAGAAIGQLLLVGEWPRALASVGYAVAVALIARLSQIPGRAS